MRKKILPFIIPALAFIFNILIIFFPSEVIDAVRSAVKLWGNNVLPSLLPFLIGINILMGLGVVNFLGVLLEPVMKPLFGVPGCGGFALAVGMTSGYPIGAKVTAELRASGQLTKVQAQRLIGFVNNSGPLFMIGAVGTGMFFDKSAGYFILISTFLGAFATGYLLKFFGAKEPISPRNKRVILKAATAMKDYQKKNPKTFGKILSESVVKAMESIIHIAGFIILFCVIINMFEALKLMDLAVDFLYGKNIIQDKNLITGSIYGFFEATNGAGKIASSGISRESLVICACIISFGGLSIFTQSAAFLAETDINIPIYFVSKIVNALFTGAIGFSIYPFFSFVNPPAAAEVFAVDPVDTFLASTVIYGLVVLSVLVSALAFNIVCYFRNNNLKGLRRR